jgi:hypothetical protein
MGIPDWPLKDSRQPWVGKRIRQDFSLKLGRTLQQRRLSILRLQKAGGNGKTIHLYDSADNVIETDEHAGDFKEW